MFVYMSIASAANPAIFAHAMSDYISWVGLSARGPMLPPIRASLLPGAFFNNRYQK